MAGLGQVGAVQQVEDAEVEEERVIGLTDICLALAERALSNRLVGCSIAGV